MTYRRVILAVVFAAVVFGLVWWFSVPSAHAAECSTVEATEAKLQAHGDTIVALVNLPAVHADQMLVFTFGGIVMAVMVKDGCVVSDPIAIDAAATGV